MLRTFVFLGFLSYCFQKHSDETEPLETVEDGENEALEETVEDGENEALDETVEEGENEDLDDTVEGENEDLDETEGLTEERVAAAE